MTPIRFPALPENHRSLSVANRALQDALTGSGYLADGSDYAGWAKTVHTHIVADVTGLQAALDAKAAVGSSYTTAAADGRFLPIAGNAVSATVLQTGRLINGVAFNGSADITVPAAAGSLTGPTLSAAVVNSALQTLGVLTALSVSGTASLTGTVNFSQSTRTLAVFATGGSGALLNGYALQMQTAGMVLNLATTSTLGDKVVIAYRDTGGAVWREALGIAATNGLATLALMTAGGAVSIGASAAADAVIAAGGAALATTATAGFLYLSTCAGTPTGAPTGYTGTAPAIVDTVGSKLWVRVAGTWKSTALA